MDTDEFEISYCIVLKQTVGIIIKANSMWNNGHTVGIIIKANSMWNSGHTVGIIIKTNSMWNKSRGTRQHWGLSMGIIK